jgi:hypothetical protein
VDFYLSENNYISTGDFKLGSYNISGINSNSSSSLLHKSFYLLDASKLPFSIKGSKTYYIGAIVETLVIQTII